VSGILRAFNATNVNQELWDSQQNAGRDSCGNFAKYAYPVIVNGKAYLPSFGTANAGSGQLCVYGLITPVAEGPYGGTLAAVPGTVLAENYDVGGQSVGYDVTSVNGSDNAYRSDGVDLETATAPATGNDIGWSAAGQWFRYTVNVSTAGTYKVTFEVAAESDIADSFHLSNSSGTNLSGSVAVPDTGGWQTWTTVTATVTLPAGEQTLTLNEDAGGWNIDEMVFASTGGNCTAAPSVPTGLAASGTTSSGTTLNWTADPAPANCSITSYTVLKNGASIGTTTGTSFAATGLAASTEYSFTVEATDSVGTSAASSAVGVTTTAPGGDEPYGGTAAAVPGTVLAENYDTGGQNVAYNVTSVNGSDNAYRSDGVDLETATAPATGNDLGWSAAGQWFHYTVNVSTAGTYTVSFLVAAESAIADGFHLSNSSGTNLSGSVAVPDTGGWQTWTTVTASVTLPAGTQTLTLNEDAGGWNIDSMIFASTGGGGLTLATGTPYNIVNENSGSCIMANGSGTANGTTLVQYACAGGTDSTETSQQWEFSNGTATGYYEVTNVNAPAEAWNVLNNGTTNGSLMQTWTYAGNPNEEWQAVSLGNGYYKFVGQGSGLCLDTPADATTNGLQYDIYTCNGTEAQAFKLVTP
jgi:hypothetical protein